MSIIVTGKIERQDFGPGTWALITEKGETYELKDPPQEICQPQLTVKIDGQVRDDIMTFAMIGPVLEVRSFEVLD